MHRLLTVAAERAAQKLCNSQQAENGSHQALFRSLAQAKSPASAHTAKAGRSLYHGQRPDDQERGMWKFLCVEAVAFKRDQQEG